MERAPRKTQTVTASLLLLTLGLPGSAPVYPDLRRESLRAEAAPQAAGLEQLDQAIRSRPSAAGVEERLAPRANIIPIVTPLIHGEVGQLRLDEEAIPSYMKHLTDMGATALLAMGETGEFRRMSRPLRQSAVRRLTAEAKKAGFMVFTNITGAEYDQEKEKPAEEETLENGRIAKENGADVLVIAPLSYLPGDDQIEAHVDRLRQETQLPIALYNNPGIHRGVSISPSVVGKLWADGKIVAIKDSSGDMNLLKAYVATGIPVYQGDEGNIAAALQAGARGSVGSSGSVSKFLQEMPVAATPERLDQLQQQLLSFRDPLTAGLKKIPAGLKHVLSQIDVGGKRIMTATLASGSPSLSDEEKQRIDAVRNLFSPAPAAGAEEREITLEGPNRPITWNVPKVLAQAHEEIAADRSTSEEIVQAIQRIPAAKKKRRGLIYSVEIDHPGISFWVLEHVWDPAVGLTPDQRKKLGAFAAYHWTEFLPNLESLRKVPQYELDWYILVRLLLIEERLSRSSMPADAFENQRNLVGDVYDHFIRRLSTRMADAEQHHLDFFEPRLLDLAGSQPALKEPVGRLLKRLKKEVKPITLEENLLLTIFGRAVKEASKEPADPSKQPPPKAKPPEDETQRTERLWFQDKMGKLDRTLNPTGKGKPVLEKAWHSPMEYLRGIVQGAETVLLESDVRSGGRDKILPGPWRFQLSWLDQMAQAGFKRWAITNAPVYVFEIQKWADSKGDTRTVRQYIRLLKKYLESDGKLSIRNFLDLPHRDITPGARESLRFWERVWELKHLKHRNEIQVALFPVDLANANEFRVTDAKSLRRFQKWIQDRGQKNLVVSSLGDLEKGLRDKLSPGEKKGLVLVQQMRARRYYSPDLRFNSSEALAYTAYDVGQEIGWGSGEAGEGESWEASAVPMRPHPLFDFFSGSETATKSIRYDWRYAKRSFQNGVGGPADALVFSYDAPAAGAEEVRRISTEVFFGEYHPALGTLPASRKNEIFQWMDYPGFEIREVTLPDQVTLYVRGKELMDELPAEVRNPQGVSFNWKLLPLKPGEAWERVGLILNDLGRHGPYDGDNPNGLRMHDVGQGAAAQLNASLLLAEALATLPPGSVLLGAELLPDTRGRVRLILFSA